MEIRNKRGSPRLLSDEMREFVSKWKQRKRFHLREIVRYVRPERADKDVWQEWAKDLSAERADKDVWQGRAKDLRCEADCWRWRRSDNDEFRFYVKDGIPVRIEYIMTDGNLSYRRCLGIWEHSLLRMAWDYLCRYLSSF